MQLTDARSDVQVVAAVLGGQREDYGILVRRHMPAVFAVALAQTRNRADAEDVAQDAFVKALQSLDTLRKAARFGPWILCIARNAAVSVQRRKRREVPLAEDTPIPATTPDPIRSEYLELLMAELESLRPEQREVLVLHYFSGMGTSGIADSLGIGHHAARKRLERARAVLGDAVLRRLAGSGETKENAQARSTRVLAVLAATPVTWKAQTALGAGGAAAAAGMWVTVLRGLAAGVVAVSALAGGYAVVKGHLGADGPPIGVRPSPPVAAPAFKDDVPVSAETANAGSAEGQVLDAETGQPISGVKLACTPVRSGASPNIPGLTRQDLSSDAEGRFLFAALHPFTYELTVVDDPVWVHVEPLRLAVKPKQAVTELRLAVLRGGIVEGRVYNVATGLGIPKAPLYLGFNDKPRFADEEGHFQFGAMSKGGYTLKRGIVQGYADPARDEEKNFSIKPLERLTIDFPITPAVEVSGRVVDVEGRAVSEAKVDANLRDGDRKSASSGADGAFRIGGFAPNAEATIGARKEGLVCRSVRSGPVPEGGLSGVTVVMLTEARISGQIVDTNGRPLAGAGIGYSTTPIDDHCTGMTTSASPSDKEGRFEIVGLPAGECRLTAYPYAKEHPVEPGSDVYVTDEGPGFPGPKLDIESGQRVTDVKVVCDIKATRSITGRVVDAAGKPVAMTFVFCDGPVHTSACTKDNGSFVLDNLPQGEYLLSASGDPIGLGSVVQAGQRDVELVVKSSPVSNGSTMRVVDAATGRPLTSFEYADGADWPMGGPNIIPMQYKSVNNADGQTSFSFTQLGSKYEPFVAVRAAGFAPVIRSLADQPQGGGQLEIRMEPPAHVEGRVLLPDGKPAVGTFILLNNANSGWDKVERREAVAATDEHGCFATDALPAMPIALTAFDPAYRRTVVELTPRSGASTSVEFQFAPAGCLEGQISIAGRPAKDWTIHIGYIDSDLNDGHRSRDDGKKRRYRLPMLPAGEARLYIIAKEDDGRERQMERIVQVEARAPTTLDFDFAPTHAVLEGDVTVDGRTPGSVCVNATYDTEYGIETVYKAFQGGHVRVENLPVGTPTVEVKATPVDYPRKDSFPYGREFTLEVADEALLPLAIDISTKAP